MTSRTPSPLSAAGKGESPERLVWRPRRGSQPLLREAPGHRPPLLRRAALNGWTWQGEREESARARGPQGLPESRKHTVPGTENATTERRKATRTGKVRELMKEGAPFGASSPSIGGGNETEPAVGRER
jgi:hypothetical protein